jgi:hypothetical protein
MRVMVVLNEKNWADLSDIGQFSIKESRWGFYDSNDFELMGENIVNEKYNGSIKDAYDDIVLKINLDTQ